MLPLLKDASVDEAEFRSRWEAGTLGKVSPVSIFNVHHG